MSGPVSEQVAAGVASDEEVALTPAQRIVLASVNYDNWQGFGPISDDTRIPLAEVKRTVRSLHKLGLLDYGPLYREDDGGLAGAGYWPASGTWETVRQLREEAEAWARFQWAIIRMVNDPETWTTRAIEASK